jgi:hypothetical protein
MSYEAFFPGVGGSLLGTLAGVWFGSRLTFGFQKRLLEQQLAFQKEMAVQSAKEAKERHDQLVSLIEYLRDTINERGKQAVARLSQISGPRA